uniref:Rhotekin isoform X2 n=1 Tax=Petromyzon marinus TaxID=7757 RepID=A0AAJ7SWC3_PETMA|nr:rhotekin isoform X2 [Petromyzon marinus]
MMASSSSTPSDPSSSSRTASISPCTSSSSCHPSSSSIVAATSFFSHFSSSSLYLPGPFTRGERTRATVAKCSSLEMELRRKRIRESALFPPPVDAGLQARIEREMRVREGACRLLAACSRAEQALDAARSLLVCDARVLACMAELQRRQEAQVLRRAQRRSSDGGPQERVSCTGTVAITDIRIPLMWKDTQHFKNKGESPRHAVFCLLRLGSEIVDTEMVLVDRSVTDVCFEAPAVFREASPAFRLRVEVYSCCAAEESCRVGGGAAGTQVGPRGLAGRISGSLGRSAGRRARAALDTSPRGDAGASGTAAATSPPVTTVVSGPKYQLLAHTSLTLDDVQDGFRTHDLTITATEECSFWLPLYGSICCRLVAQPLCMTDVRMSGSLTLQQQQQGPSAECPLTPLHAALRAGALSAYASRTALDEGRAPLLSIAITKETRLRVLERDASRHRGPGFTVTNVEAGAGRTHALTTPSPGDAHRWLEALWQHQLDTESWRQCCSSLMKIDASALRKQPSFGGHRGISLYEQMRIDLPEIPAESRSDPETQADEGAAPSTSGSSHNALRRPPSRGRYFLPAPSAAPAAADYDSSTSDSDTSSPALRSKKRRAPPPPPGGPVDETASADDAEPVWRPRSMSLDPKLVSGPQRPGGAAPARRDGKGAIDATAAAEEEEEGGEAAAAAGGAGRRHHASSGSTASSVGSTASSTSSGVGSSSSGGGSSASEAALAETDKGSDDGQSGDRRRSALASTDRGAAPWRRRDEKPEPDSANRSGMIDAFGNGGRGTRCLQTPV